MFLVAAVHLFNTLYEVAECFCSALLKKNRSSWPWDPALYPPCRFGQLQLASVSWVKERFWGRRCQVFWLGQLCVTDPWLLSSAVQTCCRLRIHAACVKVKMTSKDDTRWAAAVKVCRELSVYNMETVRAVFLAKDWTKGWKLSHSYD